MQFGLALLVLGLMALAWSYVFRRVGRSPWLALLMVAPLANVALFIAFASNRWPLESRLLEMEKEIARLRENAVIIELKPREPERGNSYSLLPCTRQNPSPMCARRYCSIPQPGSSSTVLTKQLKDCQPSRKVLRMTTAETARFLQAEKAAEELVAPLTALREETESFRSAANELEQVRSRLVDAAARLGRLRRSHGK